MIADLDALTARRDAILQETRDLYEQFMVAAAEHRKKADGLEEEARSLAALAGMDIGTGAEVGTAGSPPRGRNKPRGPNHGSWRSGQRKGAIAALSKAGGDAAKIRAAIEAVHACKPATGEPTEPKKVTDALVAITAAGGDEGHNKRAQMKMVALLAYDFFDQDKVKTAEYIDRAGVDVQAALHGLKENARRVRPILYPESATNEED